VSEAVANEWGRVDSDGTVYVRTATGDRVVGSWQADAPDEALAFFTRRFDDLATQVTLLEQRVAAGTTSPDAAAASAQKLRSSVENAAAVGDLESLGRRLGELDEAIERLRENRRQARAEAVSHARERKEQIVETAEQISSGQDWRNGSNRLRELLEEWKSLPRLDRSADDELWHRFSAARTGFTRARKAHFAELDHRREGARAAKKALVEQARALATSTDWGPTSGAMRDLMTQWKKAGRASREDDDRLWSQFREAQDQFFAARDAANAERDAELGANLAVKETLLAEAEALLPVSNPKAARAALREIQDRFAAAGKVPRDAMRRVEQRMRAVESAVAAANDEAWRRSNPEARARAESAVRQLEESLNSLRGDRATAQTAGRLGEVAELDEAIEARTAWLEQARATLAEFSPGQ
jgi:hypothetical protein